MMTQKIFISSQDIFLVCLTNGLADFGQRNGRYFLRPSYIIEDADVIKIFNDVFLYVFLPKYALLIIMFLYIALKVYGKDWKKVEKFIGTRSGA